MKLTPEDQETLATWLMCVDLRYPTEEELKVSMQDPPDLSEEELKVSMQDPPDLSEVTVQVCTCGKQFYAPKMNWYTPSCPVCNLSI